MSELKPLLKTTPRYIKLLAENNIHSIKDFLLYFPRTYEDRSQIITLDHAVEDEKQTVKGMITGKKTIRTRTGKQIHEAYFIDEKDNRGVITFFRGGSYVLKGIIPEKRYYIIGKPHITPQKITFSHPEIVAANDTTGADFSVGIIYPIYSELMGMKPHRFAKKMHLLLPYITEHFEESLPETFLDTFDLPHIHDMIRELHFPSSYGTQQEAQRRLFFMRLLRIQLISLSNQQDYKLQHNTIDTDRSHIKTFLSLMPFELTHAQKRCIKEMVDDIHSGSTMMRLLQGDVGSGKTVVATAIAFHIIKKLGGQVAFLAPIEVLAIQHYRKLAKILLPLGINIQLLTGSVKPAEKTKIKSGLISGHVDIVVGTHAIIQDSVGFNNLQLAIIDEQHKFGVKQRAFFQKFGSPHLLQMTATPIPRSLTLAFFGEFDVSLIDEMPAGRKIITTKIITKSEFTKLKPRVLTKIGQKQKVFVITPLIDESEHLEEVASVLQTYEEIQALYGSDLLDSSRIALLHGKIKPDIKDQIMKDFKSGKYDILVSTTVIEVGIDIPDATIIVIKNAERFGLSQLHQLRGRVGRSDLQSYCFLQTKTKSGDTYKRLRHMEEIHDGFKLSEIDLRLRGAGEMLGTRQSGQTDIPLDILTDTSFLQDVKDAAHWLQEHSPQTIAKIVESEEQERIGKLLV